jgi:Cu-processing system permease protein
MSFSVARSRPASASIWRVATPQIRNVARSKWLLSYIAFFTVATEGLLRFTGGDDRTLLSLANIVLFVVPLVTIVYGTIYLYNSREFIELLLAHPIKRRTLFTGLFLGLAVPLTAAFVVGISLPFLLRGIAPEARAALAIMLIGGSALTLIFTSIALFVALKFEDRLTGLGAGMAIWLMLSFVYDGLVLMGVVMLSDHAIENALLAASIINPIDLVRIALLLQFDIAALLGYTGAAFTHFFSGPSGLIAIALALAAWIGVPFAAGFLAFKHKDF